MRIPHFFLKDRISLERYVGEGSRGPVYVAAKQVRASIQPTNKIVVSPEGREETGDLAVIVRPEVEIPLESRVTWKERKYRVLQSMGMPDEVRPQHREVILGRMP